MYTSYIVGLIHSAHQHCFLKVSSDSFIAFALGDHKPEIQNSTMQNWTDIHVCEPT